MPRCIMGQIGRWQNLDSAPESCWVVYKVAVGIAGREEWSHDWA